LWTELEVIERVRMNRGKGELDSYGEDHLIAARKLSLEIFDKYPDEPEAASMVGSVAYDLYMEDSWMARAW